MRILEIIPTLGAGGAERFVTDLSNELIECGDDVTVIILMELTPQYSLYVNDLNPNIKVISLNKSLGFSLLALLKIIKIIFDIKPDIVHCHLNSIFYIALPSLFNFMRTSYVYTVHNDAERDSGNWLFAKVMKLLFYFHKVIPITISSESNKSFEKFYKTSSYETIFNGRKISNVIVSQRIKDFIDSFRKTSNTKVILYMSRLIEQKRPVLHAKICNDLYRSGYDIVLLMYGEDFSNGMYLSEISKLNSECIHILGVTSDVLEILKCGDAFLLLSSYEGLPISLLEALSVGCIPICTPVGGVKDIVSTGYNGYLTLDCSEESCYNALRDFLEADDMTRNRIKENAIKSFIPYSMKECCERYRKVFTSLK